MGNLFYLKVADAYRKSRTGELANEIWEYKHPDEMINYSDREYISWKNSLTQFLNCVKAAGLDDVYAVFEMKTPISNKAIDVLLVGYSEKHENRVLIIELKQWEHIYTGKVFDANKVYIPEAKESRRHPCKQLNLYAENLKNHHSGIQKAKDNGISVVFGKIAYLHNCDNVHDLCEGKYAKWSEFNNFVYGKDDFNKLSGVLRKCFISESNDSLIQILDDYDAVMGDEGLAGLKKAYRNEASLSMKKDQQDIVNFVEKHLRIQKDNPHKEIMVISGGPGTGKTIVGIRFILEYVRIFNSGKNDNKVIFCLPKSQTVKAMFDAACAIDEEHEKEYCCYLQEISQNQNLVVVDEAHRITKLEKTLDEVFNKGTQLLILLQDDHQILRPGEEGTLKAFMNYANSRNIDFCPVTIAEKNMLTLVDEKRCDETLLRGLNKLLFDDSTPIDGKVNSLKIFNSISDLENWKNEQAKISKTKYIFPFCWSWSSRNAGHENDFDINIGHFSKRWNPVDTDEQVIWLNNNEDDRAACIYTSQGLDMDNVAFVWWDDLKWNESESRWDVNIDVLKDPEFRAIFDENDHLWHKAKWDSQNKRNVRVPDGYAVNQQTMNLLVRNTYYVMLSRPRHNLAIWFKDDVTKKHVAEIFGIALEESMATADETNIIVGNKNNKSYHKANCRFAPSNKLKRVEFWSVEEAINAGYTPCQSCNP